MLVCMPVSLGENEAWGVSGNGLCKLILAELDGFEHVRGDGIALSCNVMPELVWKLELAADHESPVVSEEVRLGSLLNR